jgi:hypothetical protein
MLRDDDKLERAKPEVTGLESYRRLIELQKQMIELSQQHERSRREYDALRDVVAREVAGQARGRQSTVARWRISAGKWFKRSPLALARQLFS